MIDKEENKFRIEPLEERIVLDAALFFDIGSVAFFDEADHAIDQSDHTLDESSPLEVETLELEKNYALFDADEASDVQDAEAESVEAGGEEGYEDFVVHNSPIEISIEQGEATTTFDLSEIHPAGDLLAQMGFLNFEVADNDNPELVTAQIDQTCLTLEYADQESGDANLTVRGTYLDGSVHETPFEIHVKSAEGEAESNAGNPWVPVSYNEMSLDQEAEHFALQEASPLEGMDDDMVSTQSETVVKEISGFFGNSSFEEGSWENIEVAEK